jgi:predicted lactoylglutathione lyase
MFVNLPVKDLNRSKAFFEKLGLTFNPQFTDETAACLVIGDDNYAMLLTHKKFKDFTKKDIVDATKATEVLIAVALESRARVDSIADTALKAGASEARPAQDHGFMYVRAINDLDGHIWELFWMDPNFVQKQ